MDNIYSIEDMEFDVELLSSAVQVRMYLPDSPAHYETGYSESIFRNPTRFAVRSAMRDAYRKYKSQVKRTRKSGAYTYRGGQV